MTWRDVVASWLDGAFGDPMQDAVAGTVLVVSVSEPAGRSAYQKCRLDLVVEAPGMPMTTVSIEAIVNRAYWPTPGVTLPARVSPTTAESLEIDWEALAR